MSDEEKKEAELKDEREAEAVEIQRFLDERQKAGYGKPPIDGRFKKGTSGNPRGRPPKAERARSVRQNYDDILRAGEAELEIVTNGKKERMSTYEIALKKLHVKAAQGDLKAMKMVLELRHNTLIDNTSVNKRLHDVLEDEEKNAILNGHYPPNHEIFKRLSYWRKRTRKF